MTKSKIEMRKKFRNLLISLGLNTDFITEDEENKIADYWLNILDQQQGSLREKVERMKGEIIPTPTHECHLGCCGRCSCDEIDELVKKSDILALLNKE